MKFNDDRINYLTTQEVANMTGYKRAYIRQLLIAERLEGKPWGNKQWMIPYTAAKALKLKGRYAYQQELKRKKLAEGI